MAIEFTGKNKERILIATFLTIFILVWFVIPLVRDINLHGKLDKEGKFTIGKVLKIVDDHRASPSTKYSFQYMGKEYIDFGSIKKNDSRLINRRFIVLFLPENPDVSRILLHRPIDSIHIKAPSDGWNEIPK